MGYETGAACWWTPGEGVSMEPGVMLCHSITAILVNLKRLVTSCVFHPM